MTWPQTIMAYPNGPKA